MLAIAAGVAVAPRGADANCNLIPAAQREFRSTAGTVDRTLVAPGLRVAVRVDLACNPTAQGFDPVAANNRVFVRFVPPGSDGDPGLATELEIPPSDVTPANCPVGGGRCDTLLLSFPDAATLDVALTPDGDGLGPTGPVRIRVEDLAANALAEIGPLFEPTLACDDQQPESVFGHLTALPAPNDFGDLATATDTTIEATVDGNGNLLIPMDYGAVLPSGAGSAVFRILEASAELDAFTASPGSPIVIPDSRYLRSFNLGGRPIPPVLETTGAGDVVFGSVDAQLSVLRIARLDPDAPGAALYDLSDRLASGRGPILIQNATASARESAPLATLSSDPNGITFARNEGLEGDLNGDGDGFDRVPQVIEVSSGAGTSTGLAVTEVTLPGFARPVLASGDGFVAFGASEARQDYTSLNGDTDAVDGLLRVVGIGGASLPTGTTTISPEPRLDGKPLAIDQGRVLFRSREADGAPRSTDLLTPVLQNQQQRGDAQSPSVSRDGRYVAFDAFGGPTFLPGAPSGNHIYVLDRETNTYELISRLTDGTPLQASNFTPRISSDGRVVAFESRDENFPGAGDGGASDVFAFDRDSDTLECLTCGFLGFADARADDIGGDGRLVLINGTQIYDRQTDTISSATAEVPPPSPDLEWNYLGGRGAMSDDGRIVAVPIQARVVPQLGGGLAFEGVNVLDRNTGESTFCGPGGGEPDVSADGSAVVFQSLEQLVTDDTNLGSDVFVASTSNCGFSQRVSVSTEGQGTLGGLNVRQSAISDDGRFVAFVFDETGLVPGTPSGRQAYRYDTATNVIEAVSVSDGGDFANGFVNAVAISGDGRVVAFSSFALNLAPDTFDVQNVFARTETAPASLNAADSDSADVVLQIYDTATQSLVAGTPAPASVVSVAAGRAAILSGEADDGALDRNGDGDADDAVARLVEGSSGAVTETGLAASAVALSDQVLCIAVNEADHGASDLNGDGDTADDVLFVRTLAGGQQTNTGIPIEAADLSAAGSHCVFTTAETAQGAGADANGDGDTEDTTLGVYDIDTAIGTSFPYATDDLVAQGALVAFRVCEGRQGLADLNFDGDVGAVGFECIMHVLDLATLSVENTERAAKPCTLAGCDPFFEPYRVSSTSVSFLTEEFAQTGFGVSQGTPLAVDCKPIEGLPGFCDLSGDGDINDEMISVYNVRSREAQLIPLLPPTAGQQDVPPFPTEIGDSGVLYVQVLETQVGEDVNGDGEVTETPVLVLVGDADGDGTLDDSVNRNDTCVEVPNPDQLDADRDRLGDDACDPAPTPSLPGDVACDVDGNGQIDRLDADVIFSDRGAAARASDPRDPDGDGAITVLDVSECRALCTYPNCRTEPVTGAACGFGAEIALALGAIGALRRRTRRARTSA
jgi:Tol biopolymer transport system component